MLRTGCAYLLMAALLVPGCARKPEKDAFTEHWEARAQKAQGYSPTVRPRRIELEKAAVTSKTQKAETKPQRQLPKQSVTLRMYDTDLTVVIRAMARAAGQNVVMSSSIPGAGAKDAKPMLVNVNVVNAPWDETFKSILASNNLVYDYEGDIIRVMTLNDMAQQSKLREEENKRISEKQKQKTLDPFVTYRVEINYSELGELQKTIGSLCGMKNTSSVQQTATSMQFLDGKSPPTDITRINTIASKDPNTVPSADNRQPGQLICTVVADAHSNSLIIQGPPDDAEKVVQLIEKLDQPRPQIRIKAYIVQTSHEVAQALGVQWGGKYSGNNFALTPGTTSAADSTGTTAIPIFGGAQTGGGYGINNPASLTADPTGLSQAGTALNFIFGKIGQNALEAQLTALATDNKAKILSTPTITTMENLPAFVENGKDVPYVSTSQNGTNVQWAKATLKLEILPHVVDGTNLRMKISVKDDQVDMSNTVDGNPLIYKRETQSNLVVEDGDTIIISGLTRDEISNGENGVPYLRNLPLLGWAFKSKSSDVKREDMLIFIIPTILKEKPIPPVPAASEQASVEPPVMALPEARIGRP
jgi:type IV pilus assembly protein PilQ